MDRRIYGLETEFAVSYEPDKSGGDPPRRKELYKLLRTVLNRRFALLPAMYKKEGDFLENGSLLHYEAQVQHFHDGLVEWATPECSEPEQLLAYSKAQEEVLIDLQQPCQEELAGRGHEGALRLLKNNVDPLGNNYGCHENYMVEDTRSAPRDVMKVICFVLFWVLFLPFFILPRLVFLIFLTGMLLLLMCYFLLHLSARLPVLGWLFRPLIGGVDTLLARHGAQFDEELIKHLALFMELLYLPFVHLYSLFCRLFVFEKYRVRLTALLVTRQIYTGSGRLEPTEDGHLFWLSQKAAFVRSVIRVFWNQRYKPIYDIKAYLLEPWTFFSRTKRLHLLVGDSNLAELADYLKVATTGLVIQVIEEADGAGLPVLADPLEALRRVSLDLEFGERYRLTDGRELTAIEIQRCYLQRVRDHFSGSRTIPIWAGQALCLWQEVLDRLERAPGSLHQDLDWAIKRRLMDQVLWGRMTWAQLARWAPALSVLCRAGLPELAPADAPELQVQELLDRLGRRDRRRLEEHLAGLDRTLLPEVYGLFLALKKVDLKYHELSPEGYFQVLKSQGLVRTLADPRQVESATREPPHSTRARVRGEFVKLAVRRKLTAFAGWKKLKAHNSRRVIRLTDPFDNDLDPLAVFR